MTLRENDFEEDAPKKPTGRRPGQRMRTQAEIMRDRERIIELKILHRKNNPEIVFEINKFYADEAEESLNYKGEIKRRPRLSLSQVEKEIQKANKAANERLSGEVIEARKAMIIRYENLAAYCLKRHEETITDRIVKETKSIKGDKDSDMERELTENKDGNTKYLELYERCMWRIAELQAVIPPKKTALTNPEGTKPFEFAGIEEDKRLKALWEELQLSAKDLAI